MTPTSQAEASPLTEEAPERGRVLRYGQLVSEAERWVEDGVQIIRSTEFDVTAGDPDFKAAVMMFGEKAEDLFWYLSEQDSLTDGENETFLTLAPRFMGIFQELERREAARQRWFISFKSRSDDRRGWETVSTPGHSSQMSLA